MKIVQQKLYNKKKFKYVETFFKIVRLSQYPNLNKRKFMKAKLTILILALFGMACFAQTNGESQQPVSKIQLLKQFDKDGDGRLNKDERELARKSMKDKVADFSQMRQKHAKDVISKFDKDGDGKLSETELASFLDQQRKMFEKMRNRRPGRNLPKEVLAKFDKDGDGVLNREERMAMFRDARERRAALVNKYDKDGDGKLSEEEKSELVKDPQVQDMMKRMIGDGRRMPPPPRM